MRHRGALATIAVLVLATTAGAAPPEPTGPHPRMLLDAGLRAAWQAQAKSGRGPAAGAVILCEDALNNRNHERALYMGAEWAKMLQACLVAWAATDKPVYAAASLRYFTALLDDLDEIGDGKGGDKAALRDSGYAIRNLGPYGALAYDWLHDAPGMTPALRLHARQRWAAWLASYKEKGYHPRDPGTNYQAGYLIAATLIAVAQGGEATEQSGPALWQLVADQLWGKDMAAALATGGALDGGDWNEGWQYGPLSVAEYALAARIARASGIPTTGITAWLTSLLRRHVYALNPSDRMWVGGDLDDENAYHAPQVLPLAAVALGDASPDDKRWAKGELARLKLLDKDWLLYDALASVGDPPAQVPRATWPTWYLAAATATLYARTTWDDRAVWFVAACAQTASLDHRGPNAGNFVLSRGAADLIVDPSPYGSLSTLTGNAPAVMSRQLPDGYIPSQGAWGQAIAWKWTTVTRSGVVAARCDYADAFRFQDRKTDVPLALRDLVLLPSSDGHDASLVVVDHASTGAADRKMYLRFRVPAELAIDGAGTGTATIKDARLAIHGGYGPTVGRTALKDCFKPGIQRGKCDAARFQVTDYRAELPGPEPRALHVIEATGASGGARHAALSGDGWTGVHITGTRDAVVVWPNVPGGAVHYRAPRGKAVTHIVLDAPATDRKATVTATLDGDGCAVTVAAGGSERATPVIVTLDDGCAIAPDPERSGAIPGAPKPPPVAPSKPRMPRNGCAAAPDARGTLLGLVVVALAVRRRRRR